MTKATKQLIARSRELHKKLSDFKSKLTNADVKEINRVDDILATQFETGTWLIGRPIKLGGKRLYVIEFDYVYDESTFWEVAKITSAQAKEIEERLNKLFERELINNLSVSAAVAPTPYKELLERVNEIESQFADDDEAEL